MPDWAVQQLRVSLFSSGAISLSEAHWKIITGEDEANNRQAISGGKLYSGKSLGGLFTIGFSGNRCDVAATYDETSADPAKEATLPTFGSWDELSETFVKAVSPFVAGLEFPVVRMALGATVLDAAESKQDAYSKIGQMATSVKVDPAGMRELLYRVNWPRQSAVVPGLEINRLTTWSALMVALGLLQVTGKEMTVANMESEIHAVRLDLDHNTSQDHKEPFAPNIRIPILNELLSMARENAKAGEQP